MYVELVKNSLISASSLAESNCFVVLANAMIAARNGRRYEVIRDVLRAFKVAEKYDFNFLAWRFSQYLHQYYTLQKKDQKKSKIFLKRLNSYEKLAVIESKVQSEFVELSQIINTKREITESLIDKLRDFCDKYEQYLKLENAHISVFIYYRIYSYRLLIKDYVGVIKICEEAIRFYEKKKVNRQQFFYQALTPVLIIEKRFEEARKNIRLAQKGVKKQEYSWSLFKYYEIVNELHAENYQAAYQQFNIARRRKQVNEALEEQFEILKGFFAVLSRAEVIGYIPFKIGKFLNDMPIFDKDKRGNYINLMFLKILLSPKSNLIDNQQAWELSLNRYTVPDSRHRIFSRMLIRIPRFSFNWDKINEKSEADLKLLEEIEIGVDDIEIIPYQDLWRIVKLMR